MEKRLVSISIPTFNSSRTLARCLAAIQSQTYTPIEVIVVDSSSSDNTVYIAKSFATRVFSEVGLTRQRLRCIRESKGDYLLLLDSDQVISSDLVETCVSKLESSPDLDALVLKDISLRFVEGFAGKAQSKYLELTQSDPDATFGTALPRFFRSRVLSSIEEPHRELGYFDHAWIYSRVVRNGARVGYSDAIDYHLEYNSMTLIVKKFFKYYGHYFVPALVEDWRLVLGKSVPKRAVFATIGPVGVLDWTGQLMLFAVKATSTFFGIMHSIFSRLVRDS